MPHIFDCSGTNEYATGTTVRDGANYTFTQQYGLLQASPIGDQHTVSACVNGLSASQTFETTLEPASAVTATVLDRHIYDDWLKVRVAIQVHDPHFNSKTARDTVHVTAIGANDVSRSSSCRPGATHGICIATVTTS